MRIWTCSEAKSSASAYASSRSSTTSTWPWSRQAGPAKSLVGMSGSSSSMCAHRLPGDPFAGGDQHGRGVRAVLGLAEQVDGDDERVGVLVGDDQDLGRTGEQVDADLAEQLPLGLGDVGVAGTGEQVDPADRLGAEGQRRDRLHAAEQVDLVGAGEVHRRDGRGRDLAADRRRAGGDPSARRRPWRSRSSCAPRRSAGSGRPGRTRRTPRSGGASGRGRRRARSRPRSRPASRAGAGRTCGRSPARCGCRRSPAAEPSTTIRSISSPDEPEALRRPVVELLRVLPDGLRRRARGRRR